jgi:hypothetical protein
MKKLLLLLLLVTSTVVCKAQSTVNPDTVCYNTNGSIYSVTNTPGYTYTWNVASPGVITSGTGTNQISVNWSAAAPGLIPNAVTVFATAPGGCTSAPVTLNVFILQIIPVISPIGPFCQGNPCIPLVATPPGGVFTGTGVSGGNFCPSTAGSGTFNITYTVTQNGCTVATNISVTVDPSPILNPITHN